MPDPKRERQRQNREAARAAQLEAARQAKRKQSAIRVAVVAALAVVLAVLAAALFSGNGDDTTAAGDDTTTTSGPATSTTENPALAAIECTDTKPPDNADRPTFTEPPPMQIDPAKKYTAIMKTSCGDITIELDAQGAPKTVNNFVFLARKDFYDGVTFHRVVDNFVVQGGDPEGTGSGGPGYEFEDELPQDGYKLGSLAMANSGPNTNGSQFFIVTGEEGAQLPNQYSRFGMVTAGLDVAQKLESFAQPDQKPSQPLYIFDIEIKEG